MLTVPDEIKTLFNQDNAYKNVRIHFPYGERQDICNDLIVKDTVSFKESLCSQNTLKFGLCEASVFECETVGVGNIKGTTIEVSCEVECAASVSGAVWKTDLQKYVYSIPYGSFVVDTCQRQADMAHRKIVAYNALNAHDFTFTEFQKWRATYPNNALANFAQRLIPLISENMQSNCFGCTLTELTCTTIHADQWSVPGIDTIYMTHKYKGYRLTAASSDALYLVTIDNNNAKTSIVYDIFSNPGMYVDVLTYYRSVGLGPFQLNDVKKDSLYLYPYMCLSTASENNSYYYTSSSQNEGAYIAVMYGERGRDNLGQVHINTNYVDPDNIHIYQLTFTDTFAYSFARVLNDSNKYVVADSDTIDLKAIFDAYLETKGLFGRLDRDNVFETINIKRQFGLDPDTTLYPGSSLYPQAVTGGRLLPKDYQSCWYDDEYTKPFGLISCQFKDTNNADAVYQLYLTGFDANTDVNTYRVYYLENNEIIKSSVWTLAQIQSICSQIAANIEGVQYMPVDFTGRGLPYVEAGDTFEILTKSNDSITTIVLNRTITGEQTLTDSYKSV